MFRYDLIGAPTTISPISGAQLYSEGLLQQKDYLPNEYDYNSEGYEGYLCFN